MAATEFLEYNSFVGFYGCGPPVFVSAVVHSTCMLVWQGSAALHGEAPRTRAC